MSGFTEQLGRIEALVAAAETLGDPAAQANTRELLQAVLELHRQGISRLLELAGSDLTATFARDDLISSLLLLHDLHPVALEPRARAAVDRARAELAAEGCTVELLEVRDGVVRARIERTSSGHFTSAVAVHAALEETIWALAPDALAVEIVGTIHPGKSEGTLVQLRVAAP